jgi:hypothetical protein
VVGARNCAAANEGAGDWLPRVTKHDRALNSLAAGELNEKFLVGGHAETFTFAANACC